MANLDLIPKLPVLAVQAGIFVANLCIMKKLFMDPYLQVRDAQDKMTVGSQGDAARLIGEAEAVSSDIQARLTEAMRDAKSAREKVRGGALVKRQELLDSAQKSSQAGLLAIESEIRQQLDVERTKVPNTVAMLAAEVYKIALN